MTDFEVLPTHGLLLDLPEQVLAISPISLLATSYTLRRPAVAERLRRIGLAAQRVWILTDADREGEVIAVQVQQLLGGRPVKRVRCQSFTVNTVRAALQSAGGIDYRAASAGFSSRRHRGVPCPRRCRTQRNGLPALLLGRDQRLKDLNMAKVLNRRRDRVPREAIYIGRGSKWGNPFVIGPDGTRTEVIAKYREWFAQQPELNAALPELTGRDLACYCAPYACHGDFLLELANRPALCASTRRDSMNDVGPFYCTLTGVDDMTSLSLHKQPNHAVLFDASGGRGIAPPSWPAAFDWAKPCGYAGGLGPETLDREIPRIHTAARGRAYWIDMESRLRDEQDRFDLQRAEHCLRIVEAFKSSLTAARTKSVAVVDHPEPQPMI